MKSKKYILNHDFGYGREPELADEELNKLLLRNFEDVEFYINWTLKEIFHAKISLNNVVKFYNNKNITKVTVEKINFFKNTCIFFVFII